MTWSRATPNTNLIRNWQKPISKIELGQIVELWSLISPALRKSSQAVIPGLSWHFDLSSLHLPSDKVADPIWTGSID
jgi:hypothetical protein